jgi:amidase
MTDSPSDPENAFADRRPFIPSASTGPLQGLTFAAKDVFDVAGYVTGCGNPDWARTHDPATKTASVIERLVNAGASLAGKTHSDELAYGLNGENHFYGTPLNTLAPDRIPGGSSSGSASAVAAGVCNFALGTDTGGSVRVPASYCGLYGIRPTHGRIRIDGCMALAPDFDTVGWFARSAELLEQVGKVFLGNATSAPPKSWLIAEDFIALCDPPVQQIIAAKIGRIESYLGKIRRVRVSDDLAKWSEAFRILQAVAVWQVHGQWVTQTRPTLGPGIRDRFAMAASLTPADIEAAQAVRRQAVAQLNKIVGDSAILLMPTTPCFALTKGMRQEALEPVRRRILGLTCSAGFGGLPQVTLPLDSSESPPVGLSLLGPRDCDSHLLSMVQTLAPL